MKWKIPPIIKIYEALGALGDKRVEILGDNKNMAKVFSSSGNKYYEVEYAASKMSITANDNGSYWQGYLGYPAIAYMMQVGLIKYNKKHQTDLAGIKWKDMNTKFKNDFEKTIDYITSDLVKKGVDTKKLEEDVDNILNQIKKLNLSKLGKTKKPPEGY